MLSCGLGEDPPEGDAVKLKAEAGALTCISFRMLTAVTLTLRGRNLNHVEKETAVRSLGPNLQSVIAAVVMVVTIGALVFWIMGAAPRLD